MSDLPPASGARSSGTEFRYVHRPVGRHVAGAVLDDVARRPVRPLAGPPETVDPRLPYYRAKMSVQRIDDGVRFRSQRTHPGVPPVRFEATYGPDGPAFTPEPGSLESFLVESTLFEASGFDRPDGEPTLHVVEPVEVTAGWIGRT